MNKYIVRIVYLTGCLCVFVYNTYNIYIYIYMYVLYILYIYIISIYLSIYLYLYLYIYIYGNHKTLISHHGFSYYQVILLILTGQKEQTMFCITFRHSPSSIYINVNIYSQKKLQQNLYFDFLRYVQRLTFELCNLVHTNFIQRFG